MSVVRKLITVTPAAASFATPYSSGDVIGALNEVTNAVETNKEGSLLKSILVLDKANQKSAIDLVFFNSTLANSPGADNAAYALHDDDVTKLLGRISIAGADYISSSTTNAEATIKNIDLLLQAAAGTSSIYMLVVSRGTPTYGSASDLIIKLGVEQG